MARRGKTANRQARQRRRAGQRNTPQRPAASSASGTAFAPSAPPAETSATTTVSNQSAAAARPVPASQRRATANPRVTVAGPSRLTERAAEEYHYVGRDLRNIAVLVGIMAAVLVVAVIVFNVLGLGHAG
jgi:cobalamin biosynthesis Mg chelatase CobN